MSISATRIKGLILQDIFVTRREPVIWFDLMFLSNISVLVFGGMAIFLGGDDSKHIHFVLSGILLWETMRLCQYTVTMTSLWNIWSHNLSNLFIAPISLAEFSLGNAILGTIKTLAIVPMLCFLSWLAFHFNILSIDLEVLTLAVVSLLIFACSLGLLLLGIVFFGLDNE